jgi:hypothetical protein
MLRQTSYQVSKLTQETLSDVPSTTGSAGAKSTASASSDGAASTQTTKIRRIKDMLYDPFVRRAHQSDRPPLPSVQLMI